MRSLITATCFDEAVSCGPKVRPTSRGICMVAKYPLPTTFWCTLTSSSRGMPGTMYVFAPAPFMKSKRGKAGGLHTRQRAHAVFNLLEEGVQFWILALQAGRVCVELQAKDILAIEAGIISFDPHQAAQKQSCADHQNQRQGNLRDHESLAKRIPRARAAGPATIFQVSRSTAGEWRERPGSSPNRIAVITVIAKVKLSSRRSRPMFRGSVRIHPKSCAAESFLRSRRTQCQARPRPAPASSFL